VGSQTSEMKQKPTRAVFGAFFHLAESCQLIGCQDKEAVLFQAKESRRFPCLHGYREERCDNMAGRGRRTLEQLHLLIYNIFLRSKD